MVMMGVDPSTVSTGWSIMRRGKKDTELLSYGCLNFVRSKTFVQRVGGFYEFFVNKIQAFGVTHIAIETPFLGKNPQTFGKLSYLRGILYLLAYKFGLEVSEYQPTVVKKSLTGRGNATKEQVAFVVHKLFPYLRVEITNRSEISRSERVIKNRMEDITDSMAIALCGLWDA